MSVYLLDNIVEQICLTKSKCMNNRELNTEQVILEAAEAEFLEKGYGNAKMMAIAKRANVAHSMLHYYFRNKENLFQMVFLKKSQAIAPFFEGIFEQQLPFLETVRLFVETQFDFVAQNQKLPTFLLIEVIQYKKNLALLLEILPSKATNIFSNITKMLDEEIKKGTIRPISASDFILNVFTINISTFVVLPILQDMAGQNVKDIEDMLAARRESNVQFILAALRP